MIEFYGFPHLDYGHWFIFCIMLLILEALAPGAFFIWMSVAAGSVGILKWLIPTLDGQSQILIFSILAIVSVVFWKAFLKHHPQTTEHPTLNRRVEQYRGRSFALTSPLHHGRGKIQIDDSWWDIEGSDIPVGTFVTVIDIDGTTLKVMPSDKVKT
ncbi:MAG: NfeD family protein [Janthinobacterium lividum]